MIFDNEKIHFLQLSKKELDSIDEFMQESLMCGGVVMSDDVLTFCRGINELADDED